MPFQGIPCTSWKYRVHPACLDKYPVHLGPLRGIARACSEVSCELPGYPMHLWGYREHPTCLGEYPAHLRRYRVCLWASSSTQRTSGSIPSIAEEYHAHLRKYPVQTRPAREWRQPVHPRSASRPFRDSRCASGSINCTSCGSIAQSSMEVPCSSEIGSAS